MPLEGRSRDIDIGGPHTTVRPPTAAVSRSRAPDSGAHYDESGKLHAAFSLHYPSLAPYLQSTLLDSIRVGISEVKLCTSVDTQGSEALFQRPNRCPVSALNGRATAPGKCSESKPSDYSSVCVLCVQECNAEPHSDVPHRHHCAGPRVVAFCGLPHRVPRTPPPVSLPNYHATRPACRAVVASHFLRCCGSVRQRPSTLAATAMEQKLQVFLTERGHLDLLREFEAYCASPASPDPQVVVFDPEMDLEYTLPRVSKKRSANARPSEGTSSDSDSDPGSSDSPDHSGFTTVRRRRAAKGSKPKAAGLTQTLTATPSGKSTSSIYASPVSWRTPSQPAAAPQGAVDDGGVKAAAPAAAKNNRGDEADVTAPPTPAPRGPKPPPMFVQDKDRWTELRRRCAEKGIQFSQARNSAQGLKLQAKTVADFKNLQNLLVCYKFKFHTYSLKEEREIRVVLTGVPKEIPVDEVKEDLVAQSLPVQSPRPTTRRLRPPSSKSGAYAPSPASKRSSPRKRALPGQCHNCQSYGHSSRHCYHSARYVKCLGDHGTAQCTRNKDTDGPPACVLCKQKGHTANYLGCPRAPKRPPPPEKAVPRRAPARAVSAAFSYARAAAGPRNAPPAAKIIETSADDLSQLISIINIIDTSELAILAKKFRSAANPTEKLLCLVEHASLVEAIKNKL
ncbi:Nucleic-acid-binding protein from transposon X-element [Eumeta japonica]|uniref:Nucleic-acid-binding protein from transposon X-element n=1 Tax=Eumeta variegata TaxID=151549 RepID=A0A4C1VLC4_EUMVA|nr:Nucleic-acid-binding protein from transposon X-element [Eumeta japonica]